MEIYSLTQITTMITSLFAKADKTIILVGAIAGALLWIGLFVLQGFGLYKMAKNRGMNKKGLAFVPFANLWYMGKLAGECKVFGQRMKRAGVYVMIAQILATVLSVLTIVAELYLYLRCGDPVYPEDSFGLPYWTGLTGFDNAVWKFYDHSGYLLSIFQLIFELLLLIVMMALCKKYSPKNYFVLSFLTLFVPVSRFIVVFVLRNRAAVDYDAYMRAKHEAYIRRQQQYYNGYGNPYGGNYGNPYGRPQGNPYGNPYNDPQNARPPEEPFGEFASQNGGDKDENPFEDFDGDKADKNEGSGDGFFD